MTERLQITSDIHQAPATSLVKGTGIKADLNLVEWNGTRLVVKTFVGRWWLARWIGRYQIGRESHAYAHLAGIPGIPVLHQGPDKLTLVMQHMEGQRVTWIRHKQMPKREVVEALRLLMESLHARGVAHLDLRRRDNILVDKHGAVRLIDFATAQVSPPGSWRRRFLFPLLRSIDRSAFLKWKRVLTPEDLSEGEQRKLRRHRILRMIWFYNRRGLGPTDRAERDEARRKKKETRQAKKLERRGRTGPRS